MTTVQDSENTWKFILTSEFVGLFKTFFVSLPTSCQKFLMYLFPFLQRCDHRSKSYRIPFGEVKNSDASTRRKKLSRFLRNAVRLTGISKAILRLTYSRKIFLFEPRRELRNRWESRSRRLSEFVVGNAGPRVHK